MLSLILQATAKVERDLSFIADPELRKSSQLQREAWEHWYYLAGLQSRLVHIGAQAELYERVERIKEQARRRHERRSIADAVLNHKRYHWTPNPKHLYYQQIVRALKDE